MISPREIRARIANDIRFFKNWAKTPGAVGSIKPTSKQAARLMTSFIPQDSELPVLELGPGTGAITEMIINHGIAPHRLYSVEYNADFCRHLRSAFRDVNFIQGDAFNLMETLEPLKGQKFCAALSGLPLLNFPAVQREKFIIEVLNQLADGAPLVQLCYGPRAPVAAKSGQFSTHATRWVFGNIPPARFWVYRKIQ